VNLTTVPFAQLDAKKFKLAHLTGTTHVTFTEADVQGLKAYLDGGGLLFIDAAGGNTDFGASCRELLKQVYPKAALEPLSADHPIYTGSVPGGTKLDVQFRKYANLKLQRRVSTAAIDGLVVGGRTRVLFSRWDICSGFLGSNTCGIMGYAPATSEAIAQNILMYSQNPALGVEPDAGK
jgi:hypothetical protein